MLEAMASDEFPDVTKSTAVERPEARRRETLTVSDDEGWESEEADEDAKHGRYQADTEIARGGMGRVIAGRDQRLDRPVAIKELLKDVGGARQRFEREVKITARLQHPSILPLYDADRWESGTPFYVMRLVSGRPLADEIEEANTLDERLSLLPHFLDAADAVAFAHRQEIIHRDLKPSNILVGEFGETVVIDWGLAKLVGDNASESVLGEEADVGATVVGTVLGTPGYMAPEQAAGDPADKRSDVFALGSTLYHLLAGSPPYSGSSSSQVVASQLAGPPEELARLAAGVPLDLVAIVETAMARDPAERYPTAEALASDLRRFQTGQLVAAHHYPLHQRLFRFVRRHRALFILAGLALALVVAVIAVALDRVTEERDIALAASRGEADRADELLVLQAESIVAQNPTAAVAILKKLPLLSRAWPKARSVFAEAKRRGIARRFPGHQGARLAFDPDRPVLYSAGESDVFAHDLDTGESRRLAAFDPQKKILITGMALVADPLRLVLTRTVPNLEVIAVATGERVTVETETDSRKVVRVDGDTLLRISSDGRLYRTDLKTLQSALVETDGRVKDVIASRGAASFVTLADSVRIERDGVERVLDQRGWAAAFSHGAERLAIISDRDVIELDLRSDTPTEVGRWTFDAYPNSLTFDRRGVLFVATTTELHAIDRGKVHRVRRGTGPISLFDLGKPLAVLPGRLRLYADTTRELFIPSDSSDSVGGDTIINDRFLAYATIGREIFVWDLAATLPKTIPVAGIQQARLLSSRSALIDRGDVLGTFDLETHEFAPMGTIGPTQSIRAFPTSDLIVLASPMGRFEIISLRTKERWPINADIVTQTGTDAAIIVQGNIVSRFAPLESPVPTELATLDDAVTYVNDLHGDLLVTTKSALFLHLGTPAQLRIPTERPMTSAFYERSDRFYAASGGEIFRWQAGELKQIAQLEKPVAWLDRSPNDGVIAHAQGAVFRITPSGQVTELSLSAATQIAAFDGHQIGVAVDRRGVLLVADLLANRTWSIPTLAPSGTSRLDKTNTFAVVRSDMLEIHDLEPSPSPSMLRYAIERAGNARIGADYRALIWPDETELRRRDR